LTDRLDREIDHADADELARLVTHFSLVADPAVSGLVE
jgi:hypothetical protein